MTQAKKRPAVIDVDALLKESPQEGGNVKIKFRRRTWTFRPITDAPLSLFTGELDDAQAGQAFLKEMLIKGSDPLPDDMTIREASVLVQAYTEQATEGLTPGE